MNFTLAGTATRGPAARAPAANPAGRGGVRDRGRRVRRAAYACQRVDFFTELRALPIALRALPLSSSPAPRVSVPGRTVAAPDSRLVFPLSSSALPLSRCVRSPMSPPFRLAKWSYPRLESISHTPAMSRRQDSAVDSHQLAVGLCRLFRTAGGALRGGDELTPGATFGSHAPARVDDPDRGHQPTSRQQRSADYERMMEGAQDRKSTRLN